MNRWFLTVHDSENSNLLVTILFFIVYTYLQFVALHFPNMKRLLVYERRPVLSVANVITYLYDENSSKLNDLEMNVCDSGVWVLRFQQCLQDRAEKINKNRGTMPQLNLTITGISVKYFSLLYF